MIQAGKRKKEFADPYTVTGAVTKGNIITKLSLLIMGLGNIAHRQIAKGLMFLVVEIGYISVSYTHLTLPTILRV